MFKAKCQMCAGNRVLYQETHHTKLIIDTFGKSTALVTQVNACPPYSNCCMKDIPICSAFIIKYCPECGRKLGE